MISNKSNPLYTGQELSQALGCQVSEKLYQDGLIYGLEIDSRTVCHSDLFIALKGHNNDGHNFIEDALTRGASAIIAEKDKVDLSLQKDARIILVNNSYDALKSLAHFARKRASMVTIAVTGSAGKTGLVSVIAKGLSSINTTHKSEKSYNNHYGVPLSLARTPRRACYAIFEAGMNSPGEIAARSREICPDIAIITTIAPAHLAGFKSIADIAQEKSTIFSAVRRGGAALICLDHDYADYLIDQAHAQDLRVVTVSATKKADIYVCEKQMKAHYSDLTVDVMGVRVRFRLGISGSVWIANSLLALGAAKLAGGDVLAMSLALSDYQPLPGRGTIYQLILSGQRKVYLMDDSYNANPASMLAAGERISMLARETEGTAIAILADMDEIGKTSKLWHEKTISALKKLGLKRIYGVGKYMTHMIKAYPSFCFTLPLKGGFSTFNTDQMAHMILSELNEGDCLLIKGSRNAKLDLLVKALLHKSSQTISFDRQEYASQSLVSTSGIQKGFRE